VPDPTHGGYPTPVPTLIASPSSVTFRLATQDELERCGVADRANLVDGAGAALINGQLVGLTNEYGTAVYHAPSTSALSVEAFVDSALGLLSTS
jgi:hypothetical protein